MTGTLTVVDHPLLAHKLTLMRRRDTPGALFRQLMREAGAMLAHEVTRDLALSHEPIETPVAAMTAPVLVRPRPVLVSILRAGNPLVDGMLDLMPFAAVGHVGIYRRHDTLEAVEYYFNMPAGIAGRPVILADPMLATANTAVAALDRLAGAGAGDVRYVCLLAAPEGVAALQAAHPQVPIFAAAVDERLDEHGYIVPGLGDAGDRSYGTGEPDT